MIQATCTCSVVYTIQFLTQEEFKKIRLKQITARIEPRKGKKRQLQELVDTERQRLQRSIAYTSIPSVIYTCKFCHCSRGEVLSESAIETIHKRLKMDKEARVARVQVETILFCISL